MASPLLALSRGEDRIARGQSRDYVPAHSYRAARGNREHRGRARVCHPELPRVGALRVLVADFRLSTLDFRLWTFDFGLSILPPMLTRRDLLKSGITAGVAGWIGLPRRAFAA